MPAVLAALAAAPVAAAVTAVPIGTFTSPTYITGAPGADDLLFIVERGGRIQVIRDGVTVGRPFLDISALVQAPGEDPGAGGEQGLLSVAFAPDYAETGRFYVYFTNNDGDIEVDEFRRLSSAATRADRSSRRRVIVIPHREAQNHNGGQLQFRAEGRLLYFATGDGGAGQRANAPNLNSLLGKVLRIDPRPHGGQPYRVPAGNPYVGRPGRDEIFAYGVRNPWRFSFDHARIAIADVGQASIEEVNLLRIGDAFGANFGWPQYEGDQLFDPSFPGPDPVTFPIHTYTHDGGACAVTGGYVVRDPELAELFGRYIYGDFCTGELRSFKPSFATGEGVAKRDGPLGITAPGLSTFGRDNANRIYFAQLSGQVFRLEASEPTG